MPPTQIK